MSFLKRASDKVKAIEDTLNKSFYPPLPDRTSGDQLNIEDTVNSNEQGNDTDLKKRNAELEGILSRVKLRQGQG